MCQDREQRADSEKKSVAATSDTAVGKYNTFVTILGGGGGGTIAPPADTPHVQKPS